MRESQISQKVRAILLLVDVVLLCAANLIIFATPFPAIGDKGLWFFAALINIVLGSSIITPFFVKPADAIAYAVPATLTLIFAAGWPQWELSSRFLFVLSLVYSFLVILVAIASILSKDSRNERIAVLSNAGRIATDYLARPSAIYSFVFLFALVTYHSASVSEVLGLSIAWVVVVILQPSQYVFRLIRRIIYLFKVREPILHAGSVIAYQMPQMILLRQANANDCPSLTPLVVNDLASSPKIALALNYVGRAEGIILRCVTISDQLNEGLRRYASMLAPDTAGIIPQGMLAECKEDYPALSEYGKAVGLVASETNIELLQFEVIRDEDLSEGRLVETNIGVARVIYQVLNGLTKEEIVERKNTFGYVKAQARKIGVWISDKMKFEQVRWMPQPNSLVYLKDTVDYKTMQEYIGHFPGSDYPVYIKDINSLVTHNSAILGILGVGKSMFAIELVERIVQAGIKVVCLDMTNQYALELGALFDPQYEAACIDELLKAGDRDREVWKENPQEGGSINNFATAVFEDLRTFLAKDNLRMLKIYNPARLFATKQTHEPRSFNDGRQWQRIAALYNVTPVEVTRIITEALLELCSDEMTDKARACIVYEEAHSLVPEWNTVADENDRASTSGTARAILQGRKYGLGCIIVTQRTANVTKTILNQCNSVFAMRTFDSTGIEFLSNYIGKDYASVLSSLPERHAVYFGRSSSCENPVLIRLNDRPDFLSAFRRAWPPPALPKSETPAGESPHSSADDFEDDLPYRKE